MQPGCIGSMLNLLTFDSPHLDDIPAFALTKNCVMISQTMRTINELRFPPYFNIFLTALLLLVTPSGFPLVPRRAAAALTVHQNDAWIDFPLAVDFHLKVATEQPLQMLTLEYGMEALTCGEVSNVTTFSLDAEREIDQRWRWEIVESGTLPPGSTLWWRWQLTTEAGEVFTLERETITFEDDWFLWQTTQSDSLTVHWYRGSRALAQQMLTTAVETLDRLAEETGLRLQDPIALYLYENPGDLRYSLPGAPSWIGGVAFPEHSVVLVVADETHTDYAQRTVSHELGHLVVERLSFSCLTDLPVWLNEGLAMVAEGEENAALQEVLEEAVEAGQLLTLRQIESAFSAHASRASLSYAQSYSIVRYLIDTHGTEAITRLLAAFKEGMTTDEALEATYGFDAEQLESSWRASLGASSAKPDTSETRATPIPTVVLASNPTSTVEQAVSISMTPSPTPLVPTCTPTPLSSSPRSGSQRRTTWMLVSGTLLLAAVVFFFYRQRN